MEHTMSLFSAVRSADRSTLHRARSAEVPPPSTTDDVEAEFPLPRSLLVSRAGITADITTVQQRSVDTPQVHATLATILGRLDDLVDSISAPHSPAPVAR
jgi:hypothetical protein